MKKRMVCVLVLFLSFTATCFAGMYTYDDDFTDAGKSVNWVPEFDGVWSYPGDGILTGTRGSEITAAMSVEIPPWPDITSTGISVSAGFTILDPPDGGEYNAGIFWGANNPEENPDPEIVDVYTAGITLGPGNMAHVFVSSNLSDEFDLLHDMGVEIGPGITVAFKLQIDINADNFFSWDVDQWDGGAWVDLGSGSEVGELPVLVGSSGVYTNGQAQFTQFHVSADPVPVPSAAWLLASGLFALVGLRRKG